MKRQFYFDEVERDLLRCALGFWKAQLDDQREPHPGAAHYRAKKFTLRRIEAMEARLAEVPEQAQTSAVVNLKAAKQ
jgi:hypothetical protein